VDRTHQEQTGRETATGKPKQGTNTQNRSSERWRVKSAREERPWPGGVGHRFCGFAQPPLLGQPRRATVPRGHGREWGQGSPCGPTEQLFQPPEGGQAAGLAKGGGPTFAQAAPPDQRPNHRGSPKLFARRGEAFSSGDVSKQRFLATGRQSCFPRPLAPAPQKFAPGDPSPHASRFYDFSAPWGLFSGTAETRVELFK